MKARVNPYCGYYLHDPEAFRRAGPDGEPFTITARHGAWYYGIRDADGQSMRAVVDVVDDSGQEESPR